MPLAGTFDVLDFADVLDVLARTSRSGRLQVRAGSVHATILIRDGAAVGAEGSAGVGRASRTWRSLLDDICFESLRTGRGGFEFHPDPELTGEGPPAKVGTVIGAARRRLNEWRELETVIPSFELTPRLADQLKIDSLTLNQEQWQILVALDGRRSIAALARRLETDVLRVCKLLKPLVQDGAVVLEEIEPKVKALPVVALPPVPEDETETAIIDIRELERRVEWGTGSDRPAG